MVCLSKVDHREQISLFHLKFNMMIKKISVKVLTCKLGSLLILKW